jgi:HAD superfamily hydrolase (TIGR01549 family)
MSLRAFIFDIDGTLVDSNKMHVQSWDRAFRHFGKTFPIEALRDQIGKGSDQYIPQFLTADEIKSFGKQLDDYRSEISRTEYLPKVRPFPKVREFERIKDDRRRILLASSGKQKDTEYYIDLLKIDHLIEGYVSGDEADRSKPAPDIFTTCVDKFKIVRNESIVIGDTRFDVEAADRAGLRSIGVTGGRADALLLSATAPTAVYKDPADILAHYSEIA